MTKSGLLKEMTPVKRAILSRERGIARMKENIINIQKRAAQEVAEIQARIREKQTLVDALKRGTLKL
jgi:hypothetical protein